MYPITESPQYHLATDPESSIRESTHTIFTKEGRDCMTDNTFVYVSEVEPSQYTFSGLQQKNQRL